MQVRDISILVCNLMDLSYCPFELLRPISSLVVLPFDKYSRSRKINERQGAISDAMSCFF